MQINPRLIKNILVVRNDRFGEFLLNIPAMRALKETFTDAKLIAVVNPYVRELACVVPFIDEIIEWADKKHSFLQRLKLLGFFKKKNIDMAIMLNPSKEFNILTFLAGIPVRAGYDRKCSFLLNLKMKDKKHLGEKHEVEYNLELVGLLGAKTQDLSLSLKIEDNIINGLGYNFTSDSRATFLAIHPWTSDPVKQWPLESFKELTKKLLQYPNLKVIIVGWREEAIKSSETFGYLGAGALDLTGKTTLLQLAAVLKICKLLISGDSGPVHLASALGVPVLALFRNDLPGKTAKRWGPWGDGNSVIEKSNLSDITIDEVFQNAKEMINK